jgi:endonuclease YncB( thermonuclease family)
MYDDPSGAGLVPFALLAASLGVFLVSLRQFPTFWRLQVWGIAALLLGASIVIAVDTADHAGFLRLAAMHPAVMTTALAVNLPIIGESIAPMFDLFAILAVCLALSCLVALTPGDAVERVVRPVNIALLGAVAGGLLALAIAGVGFGGVAKRRAFINVVTASDIIDGDTLRMGDVLLRLWGVAAPELSGSCPPAMHVSCGRFARARLIELTDGKLVACRQPDTNCDGQLDERERSDAPRETFGRPLVTFFVHDGAATLDVGEVLVREGYAEPYRDNGRLKSCYGATKTAPE